MPDRPARLAPPSEKRNRAAAGLGLPGPSRLRAAASTGRAMLRATLVLLVLRFPRSGHGESLLDGPKDVRFQAETFHHLLRWEPGDGDAPEARFEVQFKRYGRPGWTPAPHCAGPVRRSCDLTPQTLSPHQRFFARVRAVAGNRTSPWVATPAFNPKDATPRLANASLAAIRNGIRVTLQLPVNRWGNLTFEDIHGQWLEFHVWLRRASDGKRFKYVGSSLKFDVGSLLSGESYCVSVAPCTVSQPTPGKQTEEQCLFIPAAEDVARTVGLPSFTLLSLAFLGSLGTIWATWYVKKPVKTPSVLKFLLRSSSWGPNGLPALGTKDLVFSMDGESIQHLSLSPKNCTKPPSLSHLSAAVPSLVESCGLSAAQCAGGKEKSLGLQVVEDRSGCSTDSGICLQEDSGSLSHFLDCRRPSIGSSKAREEVQEASGGFCIATGQECQLARKTEELALEAEGKEEAVDPPRALFSGYQKQSGSSRTLPSTDEMVHSQPGLASSYLKQPSFTVLSGLGDVTHTQDSHIRIPQFVAGSPHILWPLDLPAECPKTPLPGSLLEPLTSPHLSLWQLSTQLSLDLDFPQCRI